MKENDADCSRKTRQAFIAKAQNGEYIGSQPPYGYKKAERGKHILEVDEAVAPAVVWMFEMAAYHGYGYNKISRVLTERKIITPAAYQARQLGLPYDKDPCEWNIGTVYDRLYDDRMDGLISDKKFKELAAKCEAEQDAATERMEQLQKLLAEESENEQDIDLFVEIAEQYDEVEALDKELLNRLIESIVVGDRVKTDHGYEQEVTVNYRFIGGL